MSIAAMLGANPIFQRMRARDDFVASVVVILREWEQLEQASWWCERHWRDFDQKYRRRLVVEAEWAAFEFPNELEASTFLLKFGASARHC